MHRRRLRNIPNQRHKPLNVKRMPPAVSAGVIEIIVTFSAHRRRRPEEKIGGFKTTE